MNKSKIKFNFEIIIVLLINYSKCLNIDTEKELKNFAFGSCYGSLGAKTDIFKAIGEYNPDLWIWLGDSAYLDTLKFPGNFVPSSREIVNKTFNNTKNDKFYKNLIKKTQITGVWDDHDYNINDGNFNNPTKKWVQTEFLDFLDEPQESIRRKRDGVYIAYEFGKGQNIIKIILLDNRYFKKFKNILGNEQWLWLNEELKNNKAKFTFIGNGMQILPTYGIIDEKWDLEDKKKLLNIISDSNCSGFYLFKFFTY